MSSLTPAQYERMRWVEYGQSKWGDIALAKYLDWTYGPRTTAKQSGGEIIAISLHPGESTCLLDLESSFPSRPLRRSAVGDSRPRGNLS